MKKENPYGMKAQSGFLIPFKILKNVLVPLLFVLVSIYSNRIIGQNCYGPNLVPNPSFETYNNLGCSKLNIGTPTDCVVPGACLASNAVWGSYYNSDYNSCIPVIHGVPSNNIGNRTARSGKAYASFTTYGASSTTYTNGTGVNPNNYKKYISFKLNQKLTPTKKYYIEFYVCRANKIFSPPDPLNRSCNYATKISFKFSPNILTLNNGWGITTTPSFTTPNIITDDVNWVKISTTLVADGTEQYITIGNFFDEANTQVQKFGNEYPDQANYYIDDLSVSEIIPNPVASFTVPSEICFGQPIIADGSPSTNETTYKWQINWCDQSGNVGPGKSSPVFQGQAGQFDLNTLNYAIQPNNYYRIRLYVTNCSGGAASFSDKIIFIKPLPNIGITPPSQSMCQGTTLYIHGSGSSSGYTLLNTGTVFGGGTFNMGLGITPPSTTTYTISGTSSGGCTNTAFAKYSVFPQQAINVSTGKNGNSGSGSSTLLPFGSQERNSGWHVRGTPVTNPGGDYTTGGISTANFDSLPLAYVAQPYPGQWYTNYNNARWITPYALMSHTGATPSYYYPIPDQSTNYANNLDGGYWYEYHFNLDYADNSTKMTINSYAVDNQMQIYLNSNVLASQANYTNTIPKFISPTNWDVSQINSTPVTITGGFQVGTNVLLVRVNNASATWSGFLLDATITSCTGGCISPECMARMAQDPTLVKDDVAVSNEIKIFPNPSTGIFQIENNGGSPFKQIEVYNLVGEKVYSSIDKNLTSIHLTDAKPGVYLIKITDVNDKLTTKKLLVE